MIENRDELTGSDSRNAVLDCIESGMRAAHPKRVTRESVAVDGDTLTIGKQTYDLSEYDRVIVLGGGNAASQIARELETQLGDLVSEGVVVTDDPIECEYVRVYRGDHPKPTKRGVKHSRELLDLANDAHADTLVLGVITGGGSSLMAAPTEGISLADLRATTEALLTSGATIDELNTVRKHLSDLKGGQLAAAAAPATIACIVISDVVGNNLDTIASGPFVPDTTTYSDAVEVIDRYNASVPEAVHNRLELGVDGDRPETPKAGDEAFEKVHTEVIADGMTAMEAAAITAADHGFEPLLLSSRIRGESQEVAKSIVALAEESVATGHPVEPPVMMISSGETTVAVDGDGVGGPNQEFTLAAGLEIDDEPIVVGAVDTDGIDGTTDVAGAIVDSHMDLHSGAKAALANNNAYPALEEVDAVIRTGPTGTNVNDLRLVAVDPVDKSV